jgi:uncharacterized membrane protein
MTPTEVTQTFTPVALVRAGKLCHSYYSLLPTLALCLATAAWSQSTLGPNGRHLPFSMPGMVPSARPTADTPASAQYKFITIGVAGSNTAWVWGINNTGLVSGNYEDASAVYHGFVWQNGALQTVDYPGALYTYLFTVNNQGVAIGLYDDASNTEHAVIYSVGDGTWATLPDVPSYPNNEGYGINDGGVAVGNAYSADYGASVAWIWHPDTSAYSFFTVPGSAQYTTSPTGINGKGQIVGAFCTANPCYNDSGVYFGFLKQGDTYTTINPPGASGTRACGVDNSGTIVGEWWDAAGAFTRIRPYKQRSLDERGLSGPGAYDYLRHQRPGGHFR